MRHFSSNFNFSLYYSVAQAMIDKGFRDAGYIYVNMYIPLFVFFLSLLFSHVFFKSDDCWMARNRTKDGKLQADPDRFPGGIAKLNSWLHSKGMVQAFHESYLFNFSSLILFLNMFRKPVYTLILVRKRAPATPAVPIISISMRRHSPIGVSIRLKSTVAIQI